MIGIVQFQIQLLSFSLIVVHFKINIDFSPMYHFQKVDTMKRQITAFSLFVFKQELLLIFVMVKILLARNWKILEILTNIMLS